VGLRLLREELPVQLAQRLLPFINSNTVAAVRAAAAVGAQALTLVQGAALVATRLELGR